MHAERKQALNASEALVDDINAYLSATTYANHWMVVGGATGVMGMHGERAVLICVQDTHGAHAGDTFVVASLRAAKRKILGVENRARNRCW